jgi:alkylated DNA repair dioxygenase AlkB
MIAIDTKLPGGAWFLLTKAWLARVDADLAFRDIRGTTPWAHRSVMLAGRAVLQPRLVAWMAAGQAVYRYSGADNVATPWTPAVTAIRRRLDESEGFIHNACFLNLYRNERDSIGWHADDEPLFGQAPAIASLSLGARRRFQIRRKGGGGATQVHLDHGDLLVMGGTFQENYEHAIPKETHGCGERINLTFRRI